MLAPEHGFWNDDDLGAGSVKLAPFIQDGLPDTVILAVRLPLSATKEPAIEAVWDSLQREWRTPRATDPRVAERFLADRMYQPLGWEQLDPDALFPRRRAYIWERRRPWRHERIEA